MIFLGKPLVFHIFFELFTPPKKTVRCIQLWPARNSRPSPTGRNGFFHITPCEAYPIQCVVQLLCFAGERGEKVMANVSGVPFMGFGPRIAMKGKYDDWVFFGVQYGIIKLFLDESVLVFVIVYLCWSENLILMVFASFGDIPWYTPLSDK